MRLEVNNTRVIDHDLLDRSGHPNLIASFESQADAELFRRAKEKQTRKMRLQIQNDLFTINVVDLDRPSDPVSQNDLLWAKTSPENKVYAVIGCFDTQEDAELYIQAKELKEREDHRSYSITLLFSKMDLDQFKSLTPFNYQPKDSL